MVHNGLPCGMACEDLDIDFQQERMNLCFTICLMSLERDRSLNDIY